MNLKFKHIIIAVLLTTLFSILAVLTWFDLEQFQLWLNIDIVFFSSLPKFSLFKTIHFSIGMSVLFYGSYHVSQIITINRSAHASRNNPNILLHEGYYGKVRHPMYTMFLFMITGFIFAMCNYVAIAIFLVFFFLLLILAIYEEKYMLIPKFGEKYKEYMLVVKRRFFDNYSWIFLLSLLAFSIIGIFF
ncbi:MAG: hypothetical protein EAX90_03230 [Candidatus Heimdallarchaeota archaeon]|nr:hypothetical protein [Candidatus Heimdallarchaeota archaeon]